MNIAYVFYLKKENKIIIIIGKYVLKEIYNK